MTFEEWLTENYDYEPSLLGIESQFSPDEIDVMYTEYVAEGY